MNRILYIAGLAAALLSFAASADAVTWHNTGDTAFSMTGGSMAFTSTAVTLGCTGGDSAGTAPAGSFVGATLSMTFTTTYTGCIISGAPWPWECSRTFTATSQPAAGQTNGQLDTTCRVYAGSTLICHVEGTVPATYLNPVPPSTPGRFTLPTSTTLKFTQGAVGNCPMGNNDLMHMTQSTFTVSAGTGGPTPHFGPYITRTP